MNLFKLMQGIRAMAQAGKIDFPGAVKYLTDLGVEMNGIVHQALKNVFKEGKARDPEFGNVVQKLQIDDQGIPFNPNTLKSTVEKRGVENLFENQSKTFADELAEGEGVETFETILPTKKVPKKIKYGQLDYDRIAAHEDIDVELIRGKTWDEIRAIVAAIRDKADGGRIGFQVGGLSSQAQSIYDAWIAAGHTEADVLDYLTSRGLYGGEEATGIQTITEPAPIFQNAGDAREENTGFGKWGNLLKDTEKSFTINRWQDSGKTPPGTFDWVETTEPGFKNVKTGLYQTEEGKNIQPLLSDTGNLVGIGDILLNALGVKSKAVQGFVPNSIQGLGFKGIPFPKLHQFRDFFTTQKNQNKIIHDTRAEELAEKQKKERHDAARLQSQVTQQAYKEAARRVAQGEGPDYGHTETRASDSWQHSPFKDGGLATMFTRRR